MTYNDVLNSSAAKRGPSGG